MIAVVIPVLNAERTLGECLGALTRAAIDGVVREVIVVDGGSTDATLDIADDAGAKIVKVAADRGAQLAAGTERARSAWIMTLRQDMRMLPGWEAMAAQHVETAPNTAGWFFLEEANALRRAGARLTGPGEGTGLIGPKRLLNFAAGAAEAKAARAIGRAHLRRLSFPVLSLAFLADPAVP